MLKSETPMKSKPTSGGLRIRLIGIAILLLTSGFVWMATDQVIAPPLVRMGDLVYRLFICRCFFSFAIF